MGFSYPFRASGRYTYTGISDGAITVDVLISKARGGCYWSFGCVLIEELSYIQTGVGFIYSDLAQTKSL